MANGIFLLRELALKDALRSGLFGVLPVAAAQVQQVRWALLPAP